MSYKANPHQQLTLNDSFINQTLIVFPAINEERFAALYSDNVASRPNTPVNVIVGALILKENNNLNDDAERAASQRQDIQPLS